MDVTITWAVLLALLGGILAVATLIFVKKAGTRKTLGWVGGIVLVVGVIGLIPGVATSVPFLGQTVFGKTTTFGNNSISYSVGSQTGSSPSGSSYIVTSNPIIQTINTDKQASGTVTTVTGQYSVNGAPFSTVTLGTTTAVPGQTVDLLLVNNTVYHNAVATGIQVTPSSFPVSVQFNKNATVTENMYTTTGLVLTNGGTTQNQTNLGNGITMNLKDEMIASALTSTQDLTCVVELTAGTNASTTPSGVSLSLNGNPIALKSTSKPAWYTPIGVGSALYLFDVPAISDTATRTFSVQVTPRSTGSFTLGHYLIKTCYTKENFVDTNTGKLTYDVADSTGTLKSIAQYTYKIGFQ